SPTLLTTLSLHDALPISGNRWRAQIDPEVAAHMLAAPEGRLLQAEDCASPRPAAQPQPSHRRFCGGVGAFKKAGCRVSAIILERSEEHTSELQSPDHLVC